MEPIHSSSAASSSSSLYPQSDSSAHLSSIVNLEEEISNLDHYKPPLFTLLQEVKQSEEPPEFATLLNFPEPILNVEEALLKNYDTQLLENDSPLFSKINYLIDAITTFVSSKPDSPFNTTLTKIAHIYRTYIQDVCQARGAGRRKQLKGPARLFAHLHGRLTCLEIAQSKGRQLVSLDRYNNLKKINTFGASALQKEGNAFIKRAHINPLDPGMEHAVDVLNKLICGVGSAPSLLITIDNALVKDPFSERSRGNPIRAELAPRPGECVQYFHDHPTEKETYPFLQQRVSFPAQVNLAVEGSSLINFLEEPDNQKNLADILNPYDYTATVVLALITRPNDGRADNYVMTLPIGGKRSIIGIDNDGALKPAIRHSRPNEHLIYLRTILFLLPTMDQPLDTTFTQYFVEKLSPETLVIEWLANLKRYNQKHTALTKGGVLSQRESQDLSLPITLPPSVAVSIYMTISRIQAFLSENPMATHRQLFHHIYPLVHDAYQALLERNNHDPLEVQHLLFSKENPPLLEELISPQTLKEHLIEESELPDAPIVQVVEHYLKTILPSLSDKKQERLIRRVLEMFPEMTKLSLSNIKFSDEILNRLITPNLKSITLTNATTLTHHSLTHLMNEHPDLHIILDSSNLSADALQKVIEYANNPKHRRSLSYQIETTICSLNQSRYDDSLRSALQGSVFTLAEALILIGVNPAQPLPQNNTLAHLLAEKGSPESLEFLHRHHVSLDTPNNRKQTPLHIAAQAGNIANTTTLLNVGVSVDARDSEKRTPLHLAINQGHFDIVKLLVGNHADPRALTSEGKTPLHLAVFNNYLSIVEFFLQVTPDVLEKGDCDGKTPLHCATWGDPKPQVIAALLDKGALFNARNNYGYTSLHWTAKHGHLEPTLLLLSKGADYGVRNANNETPLDLAIKWGQDEIFKTFLTYNAPTRAFPITSSSSISSIDSSPVCSSSLHYPIVSSNHTSPTSSSFHSSPTASSSQNRDTIEDFHLQFIEACKNNNFIEQLLNLEKMAGIVENHDFIHAANLLNTAIAISLKYDIYPEYRRYLVSKLERLEGLYLEKTFKVMTPGEHRGYIAEQKQRLATIRETTNTRLKENEPVERVLADLTETYKIFLTELIKSSVMLIEKKPHPQYAVIGLGSMARGEMCPYSSVQFAIVVQESTPEILEYFQKLTLFLKLRLTSFGETEFSLFPPRMEADTSISEAISLVPRGFSIDAGGLSPLGKPGVYSLICTPKELAAYQNPEWLANNEGESMLVNGLTHGTYVTGDKKLFDQYQKQLSKWIFPNRLTKLKGARATGGGREKARQRKERALVHLNRHVNEFGQHLPNESVLLRDFDIKQDLYQPLQIIVSGLLLYYGLRSRGTLEGIAKLKEQNLISATGAEHLASAFRGALFLRAQAHLFYKSGKEIIYTPRGKEDVNDKEHFVMTEKESGTIIEIYRTLFQLQVIMEAFLKNPKLSLSRFSFYDKNIGKVTTQIEDTL